MLQEAEAFVRSDPQRTITLASEAEELALKDRDFRFRVRAALLLSRACIHMGNTEVGETHARRAFGYASKVHDVLSLGRCMNELGVYCFIKSKYDEALQHYREAEALLRSVHAMDEVTKVLLNTGNVFNRRADFTTALSFYEQCLQLASEQKDDVMEAKVLTNMTPFFELLIYDSDTAFNYANRTIEVFERLGDVVGLAKAFSNMAAYHRRDSNAEKALEYSLKAMELRKQFTEASDILGDYYGLCSAYMMMDNLAMARATIDEGLALSATLPESPGTLYVQVALSKVLLEEGNAKESLRVAEKVYEVLTALGLEGDAAEAEVLIADSCAELGYFERSGAIYRHILTQRVKESRSKMEHRLSFIRARYEVQHSRNIAEIERLRNVELAEAVRRLEETNAQKSEYLAFIAHELKNPLSTIRSIAALLSADPTMIDTERNELEGQILTISSRMFDLITSLLERSRTEEHDANHVSILNAAVVWDHMIQQSGYVARDKYIQIVSNADATVYPVHATEQLLVTIASNLLSNAIKFSPAHSVITVSMRQTQASSGNGQPVVQLCVKDQGPGVLPEEMSLLFTPFQRLSNAPTAGEHSSGLGLHIVKRDVEKLAGHVWCESVPGEGASFIVELPLAVDDSERGPLTIVRRMA